LEQRVLAPLGLRHTRHESDGMVVTHRVYGYTVSPDRRGTLLVAPFQQMATKTGGGSLVSTAGDLNTFLRAMFTDRPIRAATWRSLFDPDSLVTFQGRCPGFNVFMGRDTRNDVNVVVLCNNYAAGMVGDVGHDFMALALGHDVPTPKWRAGPPEDSAR